MAGLFNDFKKHAETLHKDIKSLEWTFRNPLGFFGTTMRSDSASIILKETLGSVRNMKDNIKENIKDIEEKICENKELLTDVEKVEEDLGIITKILEKQGFVFSSESNDQDAAETVEHITTANENVLYDNELENEEGAVKMLEDECAVKMLEDGCAVKMLEDECAMKMLEDECAMKMLEDEYAVMVLEDKCAVKMLEVEESAVKMLENIECAVKMVKVKESAVKILEDEESSVKMLEETEKYLELNNIDVYDIVTPYVPRKSHMKKT